MKNAKRWLAILLAVTLLCSNGIYQLGTTLSANETETTEEAQPEENSETVAGQTDGAIEDTGKATVQEVTPEEESGDSSAQDAETANVPEAAAQEDVQEGQNEATVQEPAAEAPAAEAPAAEGAGQAEEAAAPEVQTYNVKINKSELDGGQIKVWGSDNTQVDVTEYDGNNQYVKEVKEGEEFNFQITLKDGFDGAQVKVNNNDLAPESTDGNVITYKVAGINEEKVIDVTYNKVETPAEEEVKAEEPKAEDEVKAEEPEDNSVNTASLNENVSTVADTDINRTVRVGQTITLDSSDKEKDFYYYTHQWTVNDGQIVNLKATTGSSITVEGLKAGTAIVKDTYKGKGTFGILSHNGENTYTITVRPAVELTGIDIVGSDEVTQFQTMQLTAKLIPAEASGTVTWSSDNEEILTVNEDGLVTGKRQGSATVTASVQGTAKKTLTATKTIKVVKNETTTGDYIQTAAVYYLKDPSQDATSNASNAWGPSYVGTAQVNIEGATWQQLNGQDKNCFDNVDQRVISWSNGSNEVPKNNPAWQLIFDAFKNATQNDLGVEITEADVENIILEPAKISINNATDSVHPISTHLDCNVKLICKKVATVKYHLWDAGETTWEFLGAKNYLIRDDSTTQPGDVTDKEFPKTKQIGDVTYTFSGWYTDKSLTIPVSFPAQVTKNVDYYAKYVAGYYVKYDLQGGTFGNDSSLQEKHNVDTEVVVKEQQPTRAGYKFTGWTVEGLGETTSLNSGATFTMPNGNVTLTAQWVSTDFNVDDPSNVPYDGQEHQWKPTVKSVDGKVLTENTDYVVSYNTNNFKDVKTITVTITGQGNYEGIKEKKYEITKRPVTITAEKASKVYGDADPAFKDASMSGHVDGELTDLGLTVSRSDAGTEAGEKLGNHEKVLSISKSKEELEATYPNYTFTVTPADFRIDVNTTGLTVNADNVTKVYDGTAYGVTPTASINGATIRYKDAKGNYTLTESPTKKNVGSKTVEFEASLYGYKSVTGSATVEITKRPVIITTPTDSRPYDGTALTAAGTIEGFVNGETATFKTTGSQTEVGSSANTYSLEWDGTAKSSNYTVTETIGTLTVTAQSIDPENPNYKGITVNTPADVEYNGADQTWLPTVTDGKGKALVKDTDYTVTYDKEDRTNVTGTIKVTINGAGNYAGTITRRYQITPKPVTITTESDTKAFDGTALTAGGKVEGIVSGETYGFNTTGSQTFVGSSQNTYEMVWADSEVEGRSGTYTAKSTNYTVIESIGILAITAGTPENPLDPTLVVKKTHDKNQTYKAGDVITFTITAKNIYEEAKTITLEELEGVTLDASVFENVAPGAEITATATYTVTEQDIVNGTFTNNVTVTFSGVEDKFTGTDTVDEFEDANPHMTITKTTVGADEGHIYKLGEVINYQITATNDGNLTLTNVKVKDALTGNVGENAFTIDTLAPNEAQTFDVRYTVTENDVLAGKVVNNATGSATDPTNPTDPETPVTPGEKEDPIETPNPSLTVVKTSDKTGVVKLGETVTYTITVTNNGNVTINDIEVTDELTGNTGENAFTIDKLAVGESKQFTATYTVTEADILAGKIVNIAKASGTDPKDKDVTDEGKTEVETEKGNPQITVTKETTSKPANGKAYALGEEITYKITAKNTGNETLKDVTVIDELTGLKETIDTLAPGEEKTFDTSYTVKESDLGKTVVNVATATGTTPDVEVKEPDVKPGETEDPVEDKKPALAVDKKVVDLKEEYQIGDVVTYEITVTNTGNTTQKNILVEDQMKAAGEPRITKIEGANGINNGTQATLDKLAPGAKATITVEYTIVNDDRGNTITNAAVVKGDGTGEDNKPVTPEVPVVIEKVYNINVVHEFAPGSEGDRTLLPEDYTIENLKPNTVKSLIAETVTGYVAYPAVQNVKIVDEDITVTFQYYKDEMGTDPTNPEKPDGLPDEFQTVVRFAAVNGTVSTDHAVVTLFDKDGKPAKDGVGHLSAFQIAAAKANDGYDQSSLSWAPGEPTITYDITGEMTFTATFTATAPASTPTPTDPAAPTTPTTPAAPTTTPARPEARTTEPTGNAFIDNVVTPIVEKAEEKVAEIKEVFNSDDDDVPLADQKLDDNNDHKCCILHFLIMLITLLVYAFATKSMKKRQKKLHEVREELDCELAKRGLPLSTEKQ